MTMAMYISTLKNKETGDIEFPRTKIQALSDNDENVLDENLKASDINILKNGKIAQMVSDLDSLLNTREAVQGSNPVITAVDNHVYICGEVATLSFTPPATGICSVRFTSGTTATVLTVPNTITWVNGFDPTALEASTTYELNIMEGIGVAVSW